MGGQINVIADKGTKYFQTVKKEIEILPYSLEQISTVNKKKQFVNM